jgi:hypothetical protein
MSDEEEEAQDNITDEKVPPLIFLAFRALAKNIRACDTLRGLPEEIVCALFEVQALGF